MVMSVFRKIAEEFLIEGIDKIQTKSKSYDEGVINLAGALTIFGLGRNIELSVKKRDRLELLKADIKKLPEAASDDLLKDELLNLINKCKVYLLDLCIDKDNHTGTSETSMKYLLDFVTAAHEKICGFMQLIDVPADHTNLNVFRYHAAKICGRSVYEEKFIKNNVATMILNSEKENIIFNALELAEQVNTTRIEAKKASEPAKQKIDAKSTEVKTVKLMKKDQFIQLMIDRAEYIKNEIQKIDQHVSNAYAIEYMNQSIEIFRPSLLTAVAHQHSIAETIPLPVSSVAQVPAVEIDANAEKAAQVPVVDTSEEKVGGFYRK